MANIVEVENITDPQLHIFTNLTEAQLRNRLEPEKGIFIAESPKVIRVALNAGYSPVSLLMEEKHIHGQGAEMIELCGDIPVYTGSRELLSSLTGYELTRGILCAMRRPNPIKWSNIVDNAHRIAILEGIVDATNIGAIFRSAAALGIDGILLTKTCCDPLCRRAVRVSMGSVFLVPWAYFDESDLWPERVHPQLKSAGFTTAAMALEEDSVCVDEPALASSEKLVIILGTEGTGLCKRTISASDYTVKIPMSNGVDSLNVSAAAAVAFWQLRYSQK